MLCPNCKKDNPLNISQCITCGTPLSTEQKTLQMPAKVKAPSNEVIGGWIGLGIFIFVFQVVAPHLFNHQGGINLFEVACAGIVGVVGMTIGKKVARFFNKPKI